MNPSGRPVESTSLWRQSDSDRFGRPEGGWRERLYTIIFESDTPAGKAFDVVLIWAILSSVGVVMLDSVASLNLHWGRLFDAAEWFFTLLFLVEYIARLTCVQHPRRYALSFYGIVDLMAILPTLLAVLVPDLHLLIDVRILRLLRVIRIFKLSHYATEVRYLSTALLASGRKIAVFLGFVIMVVVVMGTLMYVVEGPGNGYTSIPASIYWAITTMTTVGFGDITPKTDLGRFIASLMMLVGWGVLAVPTGIVTAEMAIHRVGGRAAEPVMSGLAATGAAAADDADEGGEARGLAGADRSCSACAATDLQADSRYCRHCGAELP